jgi:hypothetical protein
MENWRFYIMFSPLCEGGNEPQKKTGHQKKYYPITLGPYNFVPFPSNPLSNKYGKTYRNQFLEFTSSPICPQTKLLAYERAKRRKLQEDKGIFKHELTSNVYYNQDMEMEMEGLDGDEAEAIKKMALHGSNVSDDTWSLP